MRKKAYQKTQGQKRKQKTTKIKVSMKRKSIDQGINEKSRLKKREKTKAKTTLRKKTKRLHSDPGRNYERGKKKMTKTSILACFQEKKRQKSKPC
jgi:hypothetical protein